MPESDLGIGFLIVAFGFIVGALLSLLIIWVVNRRG